MRLPIYQATAAGAALLAAGCISWHKDTITTATASVIGIDISAPDAMQMPRIRIGFVRTQAHFIPTAKAPDGHVHAPDFHSLVQVGAGTTTSITEDVHTGPHPGDPHTP